MIVAYHLRQLLDGGVAHLLGHGRADYRREPRLCGNTLHHRGVGSYHHVVLIHAPVVVAFRLQHADDGHGDAFEANGLADGVYAVAEEFLHDGCSHHHLLCGFLNVLLSEALALLHAPELDVKVFGRLAIDGGRGVIVAVDDLSTGSHLGRDVGDVFLLAHDTLIVGHLQRLHGGGVLTHAAAHVGSWSYGEQVGAHG